MNRKKIGRWSETSVKNTPLLDLPKKLVDENVVK